MKTKLLIFTLFIGLIFAVSAAFGAEVQQNENRSHENTPEALKKILEGLEQRYSSPGFSARFSQESTLAAMDITDTASGTVIVKRPGMMRWEYETPERQIIITDSEQLWIYRPDENQVMVGKAPSFFKDGKGAGFLSDMKLLREKFEISRAKKKMGGEENYHLKLIPKDENIDLKEIYLSVDPRTYIIETIVTYNIYDDETQIRLTDYDFDVIPDDQAFRFIIPDGVDVLKLEE